MIITLKPIKLWTEKSIQWPEGSLRIYISNIHIGTAVPDRINGDVYSFDSNIDKSVIRVPPRTDLTLDEIITNIELSLKEFCRKIIK